MTLPSATDILNMYLYGQTTPPNIDIDNASSLVRSPSAFSNVNVSASEFMAGPGRFAVPAQFDLVKGFFNAAPGTFTAGQTYTKAQVMSALGLGDTWDMQQYDWQDGTDDYAERTFIYNSMRFEIGGDAEFVVAANGDKSLHNFSAAPVPGENFDFDSDDGFANVVNPALNAAIDPVGIGRTTNITFTGSVTQVDYTQAEFDDDTNTNIPAWEDFEPTKLLADGLTMFHELKEDIVIQGEVFMKSVLDAVDHLLNTLQITIEEFVRIVQAGLHEVAAFTDEITVKMATALGMSSPLVFDLDDSGTIELKSLANSTTYWDIDVDGFAEHSGWVTGGDGLLAIDTNEDGIINNNTELFGDSTGYGNGFAALASYDLNHDWLIDAEDAIYEDLIMWVDANENGLSEEAELYTLSDLDIISINLNATPVSQTNQGHAVTHTSTFTVDTGSGLDARAVHDVWFQNDNVNTTYREDVEFDPAVLFLPSMRGYGNLPDLYIAMSMDNTGTGNLLDLVSDFAALDLDDIFTDDSTALDAVKDILFRWAGVDGVSSTSRGPNIDARELGFLETMMGQEWRQHNFYEAPYYFAAQALKEAFNIALDNFAARLIAQVVGDELFEGNWTSNLLSDSFDGITGLNLAKIDDLETLAGLQTSKDVFWQNVVRVIEGTVGIDSLSGGDETALDDAIYDSDNTLTLAIIQASMEWDNGAVTTWTGTAGVDTYTGGSGLDLISGGNSGDTLNGGTGADRVNGESGDDILDGQAGDDYLQGGIGNDTYKYTAGQGWETFQEYGTDTGDKILMATGIAVGDLTFTRVSTYDLQIDIASGVGGGRILILNQFNTNARIESIEFAGGGSAYNLLTQTAWTVNGTDGNDTIEGAWGAGYVDTIYGGDGDDTIYAYAANYTDTGINYLYGEAGNDTLWAYYSSGADTLQGGAGNDKAYGGLGNDIYIYDTGHDYYSEVGSSGTDEIQLASGIVSGDISYSRVNAYDLLINVAGEGSIIIDRFYLNTAYRIETLRFFDTSTADLTTIFPAMATGSPGSDSIAGSNGVDDVLYGYAGNDTLTGNSGNDTLYGGDGADTLYGNDGNDILDGGNDGDSLYGYGGDDTFYGGAGNDYFYAYGSGNDIYDGGAGNDYMEDTYSGNDVYVYSGGLDIVYDYLGTDVLRLTGSTTVNDLAFSDLGYHHKITITASVDEIQLYWVDYSADYLIQTIEFADGFTTTLSDWASWTNGTGSGETLNGGSGADTVVGKAGADTLNGNDGADAMHGGADNDTLNGGNGADLLHGGDGNDSLNGGDGLDTLYGGAGADIFLFDANAFNNIDNVKDFNTGQNDALDIAGILTGFDPMTDDITEWLTFTNSSGNSQMFVDRDGTGGTYSAQQIALLYGVVDLNADDLLTTGNLIAA